MKYPQNGHGQGHVNYFLNFIPLKYLCYGHSAYYMLNWQHLKV